MIGDSRTPTGSPTIETINSRRHQPRRWIEAEGAVKPIPWYEGRLPLTRTPSGGALLGYVAFAFQATQNTPDYYESQYRAPAAELDYLARSVGHLLGLGPEPAKPPHMDAALLAPSEPGFFDDVVWPALKGLHDIVVPPAY